jgi:lipopolysaccharide transport system ATP-binding protein
MTNSAVAIRIEGIGKCYRIRHVTPRHYPTLRDTIAEGFGRLIRGASLTAALPPKNEEFWALKNISFDVKRGDVVGVIGRNGAGKSTLLKLLSRITKPTTGRIELEGRVSSLLEVGTGFHPELTGRENVFLNGSILGMSRNEVKRKFDEIVDFADLERFVDTPVKRYSSGMYMRLAFSVAAHLESEILIIDEVLAVGDIEFRKKSMARMRTLSEESERTIIFVSHDISAVTTLTNNCAFLNSGELVFSGETDKAVQLYLAQAADKQGTFESKPRSDDKPHLAFARVHTSEPGQVQTAGKSMVIEFRLVHSRPIRGACFSFVIVNQFQQRATHIWLYDEEQPWGRSSGVTTLKCHIPEVLLNVGSYTLTTYFSEPPGGETFSVEENICAFDVARLGETTLWGWRPDVCVYHEKAVWDTQLG